MNVCSMFRTLGVVVGSSALVACGEAEAPPAQTSPSQHADPRALRNASVHYEKRIIEVGAAATLERLREQEVLVEAVDYGSFHLVILDTRQATQSLGESYGALRDDFDYIKLHGYTLDTRRPHEVYERLPADLRALNEPAALDPLRDRQAGLYLVQFIGPIQSSWVDELCSDGIEVVSYQPENAYVVRVDARNFARLVDISQQHHVQFVGDYAPAFRLSPEVRSLRDAPPDRNLDLTVQVVDSPDVQSVIRDLGRIALERVQVHHVGNLWNARISASPSRLTEIAQMPDVYNVELRNPIQPLDERQGQILAGNLAGNEPSGPGYLAWLANRGFSSAQFTSFSVNVVDDAYSLAGHPDLPAARIAFENNPTFQPGPQGGHGFLNAHIVAGFNNQAGAPYEDASGYNLGLGIAPWARVGVTAIFGDFFFATNPTLWESAAYAQGARVSTNAWGGMSGTTYDAYAQEYDRLVRDAQSDTPGLQPLIIVFAAGNDGAMAGTIGSPGTAKNVITVGASENVRSGGADACVSSIDDDGADSANDIIEFSSRGPVAAISGDLRTKPDLVAPGTHIQAGVPQSDYDGASTCGNLNWPPGQTLYNWSSGTSHASASVAGSAALVYQHFLNKGRPAPSPAMVKAYLMNAAAYLSGAGAGDTLPSNSQGMGRVNLGRAFDATPRILVDQTHLLGATGEIFTSTGVIASASQPLRVTLAWTDAPGPTNGAPPGVNNLDLEVTVGGVTYRGNVFSGASSTSGGTADAHNNVESVFLPAGLTGNFTVKVRAANIAGDGVPGHGDSTDQDFALVIYNGNPSVSVPCGESVSNGGFEVTPHPWVLSGNSYFTTSPACYPGSGAGYNYLGGVNFASGSTYQTISIPTGGSPVLSFGLNVNSDESGWGTLEHDRLWVELRDTSGNLLTTLATYSDRDRGLDGVYVQRGPFNLAPYAGQTVRLQFRATTDDIKLTTFRIDNVSVNCGNLVNNSGFESTSSPWVLSGNSYFTTSAACFPGSGAGYNFLGGLNNASGSTSQLISLPTGGLPSLSFGLNVNSDDSTPTQQRDMLYVELRSVSGNLLTTLATFSNLDKGPNGAYLQRGPFNLAPYAGQPVRLQFRATTDSAAITTFRIDNVTIF
ncbi:S8 family serine peptidase [Chondromyces crocatus]|uniref:Peptidase S8/S53 domain-containing protein n=1 Tax=Chondromyces crocatus TaxID=52 RepID=A0A0K1EGD7_CHOCO|nr:S8 family serine peptidase [Chondromyces crocatus]AKT39914.1 uncharacterized protein CMC5_040650 [Chondromyces crocatus]